MIILKIILIVTVLNCNIVLSSPLLQPPSIEESESTEDKPLSFKQTNNNGNRIIKVSKHVFEKKCIVPKYVKSIEHFFNHQEDQYDIYYIELLYKIISMHLKFKYGDELEKKLRKSDSLDHMYFQLRKINECIEINF